MNVFPKIEPLRGSVHTEFRRCGRPNCRCYNGPPHGPYVVRRWRDGGRQRKAYVAPSQVVPTLRAIEAYRASCPPLSQITKQILST